VRLSQCWAFGQSGVPPQEELFNVSICEPKAQGFLDLLTSNSRRKSRGDTCVRRFFACRSLLKR
jgi:hypothetical protein